MPSVVQKHATTDRGGIWVLDSGGLKEPCIRWGQIPTSIRPVVGVKMGQPRTCLDISSGRYTQSDSAGGSTGTVQLPIRVY